MQASHREAETWRKETSTDSKEWASTSCALTNSFLVFLFFLIFVDSLSLMYFPGRVD